MKAGVPAPAYAVSQFRDPAAEIARLGQQAVILARAEEEALRALGFPEEGRVLDVGCGPGAVAARIGRARPALTLIGVDRDTALLGKARAILEVAAGSADSLPFPSNHFDAVYARLVVRHLERPEAALREMHRVVRPGGRVIVIDSDDGALMLDPCPDAFAHALAARELTFQRRGADPFIGRRLHRLFGSAGLGDVSLRSLVVDSVSVGLRPFARIVLAPVVDAIDSDLLDGAGVAAAEASIEAWASEPSSFGMTTVIALGGSKS